MSHNQYFCIQFAKTTTIPLHVQPKNPLGNKYVPSNLQVPEPVPSKNTVCHCMDDIFT